MLSQPLRGKTQPIQHPLYHISTTHCNSSAFHTYLFHCCACMIYLLTMSESDCVVVVLPVMTLLLLLLLFCLSKLTPALLQLCGVCAACVCGVCAVCVRRVCGVWPLRLAAALCCALFCVWLTHVTLVPWLLLVSPLTQSAVLKHNTVNVGMLYSGGYAAQHAGRSMTLNFYNNTKHENQTTQWLPLPNVSITQRLQT